MSNVRTRFAPSPTGYMHVGNLRTALYTYLQARHNDGTFILRIEDTDQGRLVKGATDIIYGTLRATGLTWDCYNRTRSWLILGIVSQDNSANRLFFSLFRFKNNAIS